MNDYVHKVDADESRRIKRFLYAVAFGTVAFVAVIIVAIATADRWIKLVSHASERRFIAPHVAWVSENLLDASDDVLQNYVSGLGKKVAANMDVPQDLQLEFLVVEGSTVNAFTTIGGYIFIVEGLVAELDNENSLAMVIGHEIAHAVNRDPLSAASRGILIGIMISALSGSGGMDVSTTADFGSEIMLSAYSRDQEQRADHWALESLFRAYGHVGGATQLFERLQDDADDLEEVEIPEFLSSHPETADRIAAIDAKSVEMNWRTGDVVGYPDEVLKALNLTP